MKQRQSSSKNPAALMIIQRRLDEIKKNNAALRSRFSTPKGKRMATAVVSDADGVHQDEPVAKRKLFNKDAACSSASASIVDGFIVKPLLATRRCCEPADDHLVDPSPKTA